MTDEELIAMARLAQSDDRMSTGALYGNLADRIDALRAALDEAEDRIRKICLDALISYGQVEAERDAANALLRRAKTELELIRSKDCGAVYDILVRIEIDAHLGAKP